MNCVPPPIIIYQLPKYKDRNPVYIYTSLYCHHGAHNQNRTDDLILTMDALYRLSYAGLIPQIKDGAGDGNRTHVVSLEGWSSTIELHPQKPYILLLFT